MIDGKLVTPPPSDDILIGITRDTIMKLAKKEFGIETIERSIDPKELFKADECFMTGTAAHVTPIIEVEGRKVGKGSIGKVTKQLQTMYFDVIQGKEKKYMGWCTPVYEVAKQ